MGSKRVGLARTQTLIENLKRELNLGGTSLAGTVEGTAQAESGETLALTAADSGKVVFLAANNAAITLPDAAVGLFYRIILSEDFSTASSTVTAQTGDFLAGGAVSLDSNHGNAANGSSNLVATFGSATLAGDYIDLHCDGQLWFVRGQSTAKTNGIVFSDS